MKLLDRFAESHKFWTS